MNMSIIIKEQNNEYWEREQWILQLDHNIDCVSIKSEALHSVYISVSLPRNIFINQTSSKVYSSDVDCSLKAPTFSAAGPKFLQFVVQLGI